jgi:nucleoid-associated protein YgaU
MPRAFKGLAVLLFTVFVAGCASSNPNTGGITTKAYVADKDRVDQDMQGGNYGYLAGTPKAADRSQVKKTRKVYVVEFTKEPPEVPDTDLEAPAPAPAPREEAQAPEPQGHTVELPNFDNEQAAAPAREQAAAAPAAEVSGGGQEYTVQKDDTLQKISKKFYNTYSKWPKIYEANKAVLPNPNRIKPGVKIVIP